MKALALRILRIDFADALFAVFMTVVVVLVVIAGIQLALDQSDPNYCNRACREMEFKSEQVQACVKRELYTLDQCIKLVGGR